MLHILNRMAAQTHAGFFTIDTPLVGYTILLDLSLTVLAFALVPRLRSLSWDRVFLSAPLVLLGWFVLTCVALRLAGRPVFALPSFFPIP